HGPSELRDERLLHQPDAGADGAVEQPEGLQERGLYAAETARREGGAAASRQGRRQADQAQLRAGGLYRRAGGRPLQARHLSLLMVRGPAASRDASGASREGRPPISSA